MQREVFHDDDEELKDSVQRYDRQREQLTETSLI